MGEQKTICEFFEQDHDRLDELFKTFQKMKRSDFAKAKEAFKAFKVGLQRHIVWEEDLLFPLWEEKTGMSEEGPTATRKNRRCWTCSVPIIGKKSGRSIPPSIR